MIEVPQEFQKSISVEYPPENKIIFEEWFAQQNIPETEREYLPIFFTSYWVNNSYGNDEVAKQKLQSFIDTLPYDKKLHCVVQYDDGVLIDFKGKDVLVFNMSKTDGYPIPLLCQPHSYQSEGGKDIFCSFIGSHTHPIRDYVFNLQHLPEYYITDHPHDISGYCRIINKSVFGLCPRGYGLNSFRIVECMQYGTIPVYISDSFVFPYNLDFNEFGVVIEEKNAHRIDEILKSITALGIIKKQDKIKELYESHFTYPGCYNQIIKVLSEN